MLLLIVGVCFLYAVTAREWPTHETWPTHDTWHLANFSTPVGETAELRCSFQYNQASAGWVEWTYTNNTEIFNSSKFQITTYYTVGYCAITDLSDSLAIASGINSRKSNLDTGNLGEHDFLCVNTVLKIYNTTENDYGIYKCTKNWDRVMLSEKANPKARKQVVYNKSTNNENASLSFIKHCIAEGSRPVTWKIFFSHKGCLWHDYSGENYGRRDQDPCLKEEWIDLEDIRKFDNYVWFPSSYQVNSTSNGILSESFLRMDVLGWAARGEYEPIIFCVVEDGNGKVNNLGLGTSVSKKWQNCQYFWHRYDNTDCHYPSHYFDYDDLTLEIVLPLSCFFVVALLIAVVRSRCCYRAPDCLMVALGKLINKALQAREQHVYMVVPTCNEAAEEADQALSEDSMMLNVAE